eukprot:6913578-Lingulodinium_polyedra.AAC.1
MGSQCRPVCMISARLDNCPRAAAVGRCLLRRGDSASSPRGAGRRGPRRLHVRFKCIYGVLCRVWANVSQ